MNVLSIRSSEVGTETVESHSLTYNGHDAHLQLVDEVTDLCVAIKLHVDLVESHLLLRDVALAVLDIVFRLVQLVVHVEKHVGHDCSHLVLNVKLSLSIR